MNIEQKIQKWLEEITEENMQDYKDGKYEFDQNYLDKVNNKWMAIRQFISDDSELIQKYTDCYNSFFRLWL